MAGLASVIYRRVSPHHHLLSSAAYIAAFIVVCIFPSFDRRTEIEEHGLIPGYASSGFDGHWSSRLRALVADLEANPKGDVEAVLERSLSESQLVLHRRNFTTLGGLQSSLAYVVVPSSRGDSREAVVLLVASNRTASKKTPSRTSGGLGVGAMLAKYFKSVHWLSKDVFVVFVDSSLPYGAGARAWLRDYFGGTSAVRRGVLRQAIVLDAPNKATSLVCDVEGINGAVPNQDIVNAYMVGARERPNLPVFHKDAWDSVYHHFNNGGVHSSHAPFLELQIPAFTVKGQRNADDKRAGRKQIDMDSLARSVEGIIRCFSNNLQQLHHSFNFYFFTGTNSHISSGLYLYPVFAMQLPLISFLMTVSSYRDIRALLVGLGAIGAVMAAAGGPLFLLATEPEVARMLDLVAPGTAAVLHPPECLFPGWDEAAERGRRQAAATWLACGCAGAALVALLLRGYAFRVFQDRADGQADKDGKGVQLPAPLWESMRAASGFAFLITLAPVTIYSWALAVPLTMVCVPLLILVRPFSLWHRPVRSLLVLGFLAGNMFLIAEPGLRASVLGEAPRRLLSSCMDFYHSTVLPAVPREARKYMPTPLMTWLHRGRLGTALKEDLLLALYEAARDFNCVGGMLFPVLCFVYWPLLVFVLLVSCVLPAQKVEDDGMSFRQLRLGALFVLSLVIGGIAGGVVWRSYSSSGLGKLQW